MASPAVAPSRWLYGPWSDVLFGCGVGYALVFLALLIGGADLRYMVPYGLLPLVSVFAGTPHYGATLLRVYEKRSEVRAYAFFAIYLTLFVWALYYAGLFLPMLGTFLLTLYLTWSPWHYTGQNYGIALLFLRRRGVAITPVAKRLIYSSFILSYGLTFLAIHGAVRLADYAWIDSYGGSIYHFISIGIPSPFWEIAFLAIGAGYVCTTLAAGAMLHRGSTLRDLLPSALVVLTQALWFSLPPVAHKWGLFGNVDVLSIENMAFLFVFIGAGHSIQYLWVTSFYALDSESRRSKLLFYGKCILAGSAIWSLPAFLYVRSGLATGGAANALDASVLLAAVVNLHHFMLDGAIWKLRDGRVARILIRRDSSETTVAASGSMSRFWRYAGVAFVAFGAYWAVSTTTALLIGEFGITRPLARGDVMTAERSVGWLHRFGRDGAGVYLQIANEAARAGNVQLALRYYDESFVRSPVASTLVAMGALKGRTNGPAEAIPDYERAIALDPNDFSALSALGMVYLRLDEPAKAHDLLERAVAVAPDREVTRLALERAKGRLQSTTPASGGGT